MRNPDRIRHRTRSIDQRCVNRRSVVKPAKQPCCGKILECLHAAEDRMSRILAGTVHVIQELPITLAAGSAGRQTRVMCCTCRSDVRTKEFLSNHSISAPGIARTAWTPRWTSAGTACMGRGGKCSSGKEYHKERETNRFHHIALFEQRTGASSVRYLNEPSRGVQLTESTISLCLRKLPSRLLGNAHLPHANSFDHTENTQNSGESATF